MKEHRVMTHYYALVHKDKDSAYGIHFPDLPGCFSAADNADDIVPNAMEALELYVEDLDSYPSPMQIDLLSNQTDITNELQGGAFLVSVPLVKNTGKSVRINISMDKGLVSAIDDVAGRRNMTRSGFLAQAAEREIGG